MGTIILESTFNQPLVFIIINKKFLQIILGLMANSLMFMKNDFFSSENLK